MHELCISLSAFQPQVPSPSSSQYVFQFSLCKHHSRPSTSLGRSSVESLYFPCSLKSYRQSPSSLRVTFPLCLPVPKSPPLYSTLMDLPSLSIVTSNISFGSNTL